MSADYRHGTSPTVIADIADASVGAVVTDPPYGTASSSAIYGRRREDGTTTTIANDADLTALAGVAPLMARVLRPDGVALVFCAPSMRRAAEDALSGSLDVLYPLTWDKGAPGISYRVRYAHEDVLLCAPHGSDPWATRGALISPLRVPRVQFTQHPNEKPVDLLRQLIRWALPDGGVVLDPFAGIASCGVAALAERCDYIGAECDARWWPIAEERLAAAAGRPDDRAPQGSLLLGGAA